MAPLGVGGTFWPCGPGGLQMIRGSDLRKLPLMATDSLGSSVAPTRKSFLGHSPGTPEELQHFVYLLSNFLIFEISVRKSWV